MRGDLRRNLDWVFGALVPSLCLLADPCVFRDAGLLSPLWPRLQAPAYLFLIPQIAVFVIHLVERPMASAWNLFATAYLGVGGVAAIVIGIGMLEHTLVGMIVLIGALGFTPFATGIVFLRNAALAGRRTRCVGSVRRTLILAAGLVAAVVPAVGAWAVGESTTERAVAGLRAGGPGAVDDAVRLLRRWRPLVHTDDLVDAHRFANDTVIEERLGSAYRRVTGKAIDQRILEQDASRD